MLAAFEFIARKAKRFCVTKAATLAPGIEAQLMDLHPGDRPIVALTVVSVLFPALFVIAAVACLDFIVEFCGGRTNGG